MSESIKKRTAAVTPRGVNHLVLNVRDMEESPSCNATAFRRLRTSGAW